MARFRRGMDIGKGKGYRNIRPMFQHDRRVHQLAGKGIKSPQRMPIMLKKGDSVTAKFTQAKGTVVSTDPFAVKYHADSRDYVRLSNPKFWQKGGKISTKFKNYAVYRVGKLPKYAKIRMQDIGRKGHSYRLVFQKKDGSWHTYEFLINKKDINTLQAKALIRQIKAVYPHAKGGKISDTLKTIGKKAKEAYEWEKEHLPAQKAWLKEKAKQTGEIVKDIGRKAKEKRLKEVATVKADIRPELHKLDKQHKRVDTLKQQISEQEDKGMDTSDEIEELETEMQQLRKMQEKATNINLEDLNNKEIRLLAIRHKDDGGFLSGFFGSSKNEFEEELLRRIHKEKEVDHEIKLAQRKPLEAKTGFF
jgi:GTP cyclohydrolase II